MAQVKLKRLLSSRRAAACIITDMLMALDISVCIEDDTGQILLGTAGSGLPNKYPIELGGDILGWVAGEAHAVLIADLLTYLAQHEDERKSLADEALDRYRELNLLYNLSGKLAASLELETVAHTVLDEATRLIETTGGAVLLRDAASDELKSVASFGQPFETHFQFLAGQGIIGTLATSDRAEIVNDVGSDPRFHDSDELDSICSLAYAPFKGKDEAIGSLILVSSTPVSYTAGDLKLLNTLVSQAAPAIENALLYEKMLREAQEREERLQRQIRELRIEIDEAKRDREIAEITGSDYFQQLRNQADELRQIMED
jgi:transcriptional regulator with GAF, ATPase, and Fis domain